MTMHSDIISNLETDYSIGYDKAVLCPFINYLGNFLFPVFIMKVLLHDYNAINFCNDFTLSYL